MHNHRYAKRVLALALGLMLWVPSVSAPVRAEAKATIKTYNRYADFAKAVMKEADRAQKKKKKRISISFRSKYDFGDRYSDGAPIEKVYEVITAKGYGGLSLLSTVTVWHEKDLSYVYDFKVSSYGKYKVLSDKNAAASYVAGLVKDAKAKGKKSLRVRFLCKKDYDSDVIAPLVEKRLLKDGYSNLKLRSSNTDYTQSHFYDLTYDLSKLEKVFVATGEKETYRYLLSQLKAGKYSTKLLCYDDASFDIESLLKKFRYQFEEYRFTWKSSWVVGSGYKTYYVTSDMDEDERIGLSFQKADEILAKIITPGMTEEEKVKAIHDYLILNCAYDEEACDLDAPAEDSCYYAYGCLNENSAVCNGYAEAFNLLAHKCDIPSTIVTGTANGGGHAWNYVVLDGEGYYVDTTWDDPIPDQPGRIREDYYLISKEQLMEDHSWVEEDFIDSLFEEQVQFYQ
jgi:hypothetical protein